MGTLDALLAAAVATIVLFLVPGARFFAYPLVLFGTLVHELGHGFTAMLVGGSFRRLRIHANGSGSAESVGRFSPLSRALVAAGGPLGPPLAGLALFWAAREGTSAHVALGVLATTLFLVALIWVRNLFGVVLVPALGAAIAVLAWRAPDDVARIACAFLAIQFSLSAFSRADYLFKSHARTAEGLHPSDTQVIADALGLPHWFWGGLLALVSLTVVASGFWIFAGGDEIARFFE